MSRSRHRRPSRRPAKPRAAGPPVTLRIDRLASGGDAVAVGEDGRTVFVEGGVPGDVVRVRIESERSRWARGRVDEVIESSPLRVEPRCPHFERCGGCAWQHIEYAAQVEAKGAILRDALERIGGFMLPGPPPMTASPDAYGYRGRARLLVQGGLPGYRERGSHRHCPVSRCPVLAPELEAVLADLSVAMEERGARASTQGELEWSICLGRDGRVSRALQPVSDGEASRQRSDVLAGEPATGVEIEVDGERVEIDAAAFSQANRLLYTPLARRVLDVLVADPAPDDVSAWRVLEVHAGVGFLTLPLARRVAHVVAVEADAHAVSLLRRNVARMQGVCAAVEIVPRFFGEASAAAIGGSFDAVVLDPPRAGLAPSEIELLVALAPPRIVYLSCDPATLARDARALAEAGWRLSHVEGFDLFPQTPHTEGLIRLDRVRTNAHGG